ncbi:unnamed protein product, partial [Cylindrotheca closterium]
LINLLGGFMLIGWCKKGLLQIDGETKKVANDEVTLHLISLVYPQKKSIFSDPDMITQDFDIPDKDLQNFEAGYFVNGAISSDCE